MTQHATTQWILCVNPFHAAEIARHLGHALSEPHDAVVEKGTGVPIGRIGIYKSCGREEEEGGDEVTSTLSNNYSRIIPARGTDTPTSTHLINSIPNMLSCGSQGKIKSRV